MKVTDQMTVCPTHGHWIVLEMDPKNRRADTILERKCPKCGLDPRAVAK